MLRVMRSCYCPIVHYYQVHTRRFTPSFASRIMCTTFWGRGPWVTLFFFFYQIFFLVWSNRLWILYEGTRDWFVFRGGFSFLNRWLYYLINKPEKLPTTLGPELERLIELAFGFIAVKLDSNFVTIKFGFSAGT